MNEIMSPKIDLKRMYCSKYTSRISTQALIIAIVIASIYSLDALAQSIPKEPTDRYNCESIVLSTYLGYERAHLPGTTHSLKIFYRVVRIFKGPLYGGPISVRFDIEKNTESPKEGQRKIKDKSMLPKKDSQWILFMPFSMPNNGSYETFEGAKGRIPFSESASTEIVDELKKRGQLFKYEL